MTRTRTQWLLVEDEPAVFELLIHVWDVVNMRAIAHSTGEDALFWLETLPLDASPDSPLIPKFALIDIRLPGAINGVEVAQEIRKHPVLYDMPIAFMTAYRLSYKQEQEILEKAQVKHIFYKPFNSIDELRNMLMNLT